VSSCFLFLLCVRFSRPSWSTVFPYTTLFRSADRVAALLHRQGGDDAMAQPGDHRGVRRRDHPGAGRNLHQVEAHGAVLADGRGPDRKSTRLNSSHVKISYAVFCLKKKNEVVL